MLSNRLWFTRVYICLYDNNVYNRSGCIFRLLRNTEESFSSNEEESISIFVWCYDIYLEYKYNKALGSFMYLPIQLYRAYVGIFQSSSRFIFIDTVNDVNIWAYDR